MSAEFTPAVRAIVQDRSGGVCEVCGHEQVFEIHHRHPRKAGGTKREWVGLASNAFGVCRLDHNLIESRRKLARLMGWLVPEGSDPARQAVLYRGRLAVLDNLGNVDYIGLVVA